MDNYPRLRFFRNGDKFAPTSALPLLPHRNVSQHCWFFRLCGLQRALHSMAGRQMHLYIQSFYGGYGQENACACARTPTCSVPLPRRRIPQRAHVCNDVGHGIYIDTNDCQSLDTCCVEATRIPSTICQRPWAHCGTQPHIPLAVPDA